MDMARSEPPDDVLLIKLLQENQRLLKENNRLLVGMRRRARLAFLGSVLRLIIWLGILAFVYVNYISPQLESLQALFTSLQEVHDQTSATEEWLRSIPGSLRQ